MSNPTIIGDATLYLGRCEDVLPSLPDTIDAVMDPQYEFDTSGGGKFRKARPNMDEIAAAGLDQGFDVSLIDAARFRSVAVFCHNDQLHGLLAHLQAQYGRYVVGMWHKSNPLPVANKHCPPDSEPWVWAWRHGGHPVGTLKDKARYWIGPNGKQARYDHPTVKPIDLMRKLVRCCPGDTVTDLYMGTGTTGAAAIIEGRRFVGVEVNPDYFAMACDRIACVYRDRLNKRRAA